MSALAAIEVSYHLSGCRSLKERRSRLQPLLDRLGRQRLDAVLRSPEDDVDAVVVALDHELL